ncbi:MAG: MerR family transcriptional regulator [Flavobacteriaceae bacterium]
MNIKDQLSEYKFNKKDISLSYRALNHYDEQGLLISERPSNNEWRTFNGFELIWLNLIVILREIGFSLKKIKTLKRNLFEIGQKGLIDRANYINRSFYEEILLSIEGKYSLFILIFYDSTYTFHDTTSLNQWNNSVYKNEPHINIPLSNIIKDVLNKTREN